MRRVAIIGSGGAGKSTLARELGERTGIEVIHLDGHFWRPGWVETPADEWRALQADLCARDAWIMDGNYGGTLDLRLARADTVVFVDLPRRVTIPGVLRRWVLHHGEAVQAPGCPEHVSGEFLRWVWGYPRGGRVRAGDARRSSARRPRRRRPAVPPRGPPLARRGRPLDRTRGRLGEVGAPQTKSWRLSQRRENQPHTGGR